jgi:fructose-1,6-bisphosphatase II
MSVPPTAIDHAAPAEGTTLLDLATARAHLARLEPTAIAATRAAAIACQRWSGRGDGLAADAAATDAMRNVLAAAPGTGTVVIGEGAKDSAPMLYDGEVVGTRRGLSFDIAVDPLECTNLCAMGLPGSLATIAFAEAGSMARLGPSFYMDKLVGPPATRDAIDIRDTPKANLVRVGRALEKSLEEVRVVVLDKPRHAELIEELHVAGACVISPPEGDVAGALAPLLPGGGADLLMGIGGTPEGVLTACAVRALGGCMQAQLAPQRPEEKRGLLDAGLSVDRVYSVDDLVSGDAFFTATGVTGGELLRSPWRSEGRTFTHSVVVARGSMRKVVEATVAQP